MNEEDLSPPSTPEPSDSDDSDSDVPLIKLTKKKESNEKVPEKTMKSGPDSDRCRNVSK